VNAPDFFTGELKRGDCRWSWVLHPKELAVTGTLTRNAGTERFLLAVSMTLIARVICLRFHR